jgi:integrase
LTALTVDRLDLLHGRMVIDRQFIELSGNRIESGPPKSDAGYRTVALPPHIVDDLRRHLAEFRVQDCDLVFCTPTGGPLRRRVFAGTFSRAKRDAGVRQDLRFHDLRHTGNTLAAATGASLRDLMHRMGHSSVSAAMLYQHATRDRDDEIARLLSERAAQAREAQSASSPVVSINERREGPVSDAG